MFLLAGLSVPILMWVGYWWWFLEKFYYFHSVSITPDWGMRGETLVMPFVIASYVAVLLYKVVKEKK